MLNHIKKYVIATRPWSFTMSFISVSTGTLLAAEEGPVSWFWFAITAVGIILFHAAANLINDYFDTLYEIDQRDSPTAKYRLQPILSGMLTPRQLLAETFVLLSITIAIGMTVAMIRSWHVLWIGIIGLLTSIFYTAGPVKFKYRAFGEFAVFMMWGPLMIEGAYAVQCQALSIKAFYISVPFGVNKPVCSECKIHCFKPEMRSQIKEVMRFAGPRMNFKHPVLAIHHLIRKCR